MNVVVLIGRILFALIFVTSGFGHFKQETISHAQDHGVPMAGFLVPAAGVLAIVSGVLIMIGYQTQFAAWGIVLFLIPITFTMHNFWAIEDPMQRMTQHIMFMKNISILGGALLIAYFGAGPLSIDNWQNKP
jgi:putative oxidoreductase